ncbi:MAG: type I-D CRISPR-associated protein Cas5/Csc1 [Candidatus Odinarchaeota archaeon]
MLSKYFETDEQNEPTKIKQIMDKLPVHEVIVTPHDFFFYSSREFNTRSIVNKFMGNYALMYAFNQQTKGIHRTTSTNKSHYRKDLRRISTYITPASPCEREAIIQAKKIRWKDHETENHTYNALGESLAFTIVKAEYNYPNLGSYEKFTPLCSFKCFAIGNARPGIIRWGKKLVPCRVSYREVKNPTIKTGTFSPSHPINTADVIIDPESVSSCSVVYTRPANLLIGTRLTGTFIEGQVNGRKVQIALPKLSLYPAVFS